MRYIYWSCCQDATSLSPISPSLLLWKRQRRGLAAPPPRMISFTSWRVCSRNIPRAPLPVAAWMPEPRVGVLPAYRRCERCCASQQNRSLMSALGHKRTTDLTSRGRGCPLSPQKRTSFRSFPPPAFRECRHTGTRLVADARFRADFDPTATSARVSQLLWSLPRRKLEPIRSPV